MQQPAGAWMQIRGVTKQFGGVRALDDVNIDIRRGEVHGLVGANGAGKSTLINCLAGVTVPDRGSVSMAGNEVQISSPRDAEEAGLAFIHQELNLVPHFSSLENILLGAPKVRRLGIIDWKRSTSAALEAAGRIGIDFPLHQRVDELSVAERWLVMISKALVRAANLIAMDEPSASLSAAESDRLFDVVKDLSADGVAILYVSHRLDEVLELSDRITVFRDGQVAARAVRGDLDKKGLIRAIVGHDVATNGRSDRSAVDRDEPPLFSARSVVRGTTVRGVSFDLYRGEVLGLGGLIGAGRTEVARLAFGADRLDAGHFELNGEVLNIKNEPEAVRRGIGMVPEERRSQGLMLTRSVSFNMNIGALDHLRSVRWLPFMNFAKMRARARSLMERLLIKASSISAPVDGLSGGNQQKTLIGRWLTPAIKLLFLDEPSRGVDIGSREQIHGAIRDLAAEGVGTIVISSDVEELAVLCDRVVVMHEGVVTGELLEEEITEGRIIELSYNHREAIQGEHV